MSHTCLYSPAAEHHRTLAGTHFPVPLRVGGWVGLGGLVKYWGGLSAEDGHSSQYSTNRARRRVTSLIRPTMLYRYATPPLYNSHDGRRAVTWRSGLSTNFYVFTLTPHKNLKTKKTATGTCLRLIWVLVQFCSAYCLTSLIATLQNVVWPNPNARSILWRLRCSACIGMNGKNWPVYNQV